MMKKFALAFILVAFFLNGKSQDTSYTLKDFYTENTTLSLKVDMIYDALSDEQRVGQMIVPAAGKLGRNTDYVLGLVKKNLVGGILLLNGTVDEFKALIKKFDSTGDANGTLPLLYSADAELSLINQKIKGTHTVKCYGNYF